MRHGETLFNQQHKIQGWSDSPLTDLGILQAKKAATYFNDREIAFDEAYSSTSERASDTLELITNIEYTRVKDLREWNFGSLEGEGEYLNPPLPYGAFFKSFNGEDETEFQERFVNTVNRIMADSKGKAVLIVAHGAALSHFMRWAA